MDVFGKLLRGAARERSARLAARVAVELRVRLRVGSDGEMQSVLLADLSVGGARITTPLRINRSRQLMLVIDTDGEPPIVLPCRIASIRRRRGDLHIDYGLAFDRLRPAGADRVRRLVEKFQTIRAGNAAFSAAHGR